MSFLYHTFVFFSVLLPIIWLNVVLTALLKSPLFLYSTVVMFSVCTLKKNEGVFCTILLGLLIDAINFEAKVFGLSALLLSGSVILFQNNSWRNVFRYRTFTWGFSLNFLLQLFFVYVHFLAYGIPVPYLKGYFLTFTLSALLSSLLAKGLLKLKQNYLL